MSASLKITVALFLAMMGCENLLAGSNLDLPQWRGVNRDGISAEKGLLKQLPAEGPKLVWKVQSLGSGYSGVTVVKGKIFTVGDVGGDCVVMALNELDGKTIWSTKIGPSGGYGGFDGSRGTPAVADDQVCALNQHGDLVCLETAEGKEVWRKSLTKDFGGSTPNWGYSESPLIEGDKVLCTPGGQKGAIVALNRKTGDTVWQSKEFTDSAHYSSLVPATIAGQRQVIQLTEKSVVGISVADGKVLWRADRQGKVAVVPMPVYADNQVFVTSGYGIGCDAFKISKATDGFKTEQVYQNKDMVNHHGGVILMNGYIYGFSDSKGWVCMDFKTGQVAWSNPGVGKGSIAYVDGHFYIRGEAGNGPVALIEASSTAYTEKGRFDQPDRSNKNSWTHPAIVNGKLYIRDQGLLLCYDIKSK